MAKVVIKILDEVHSAVIGLTPDEHKILDAMYSLHPKGYFFSPKYKLGRWDGLVHFYSKAGKTYNYLIPEIHGWLKQRGHTVKIVDMRANWKLPKVRIDETYFKDVDITLADHQVEAINAIMETHKGIILAGTGAGKTILTAALVDIYNSFGFKCMVIVPNQDLIKQTKKEFDRTQVETGMYWSEVKDLNHKNCISTWQSLNNNPQLLTQYNVLIVDEVHEASEHSILSFSLMKKYAKNIPIRIGMTGSMPKTETDLLNLHCCLGEVIYEIRLKELMTKGWSAKLDLKILILEEDFTERWEAFRAANPNHPTIKTLAKFRDHYFPDFMAEKDYLSKNPKRNAFIADIINAQVERTGNAFVLVSNLSIAKRLAKLIPNAIILDAKSKDRSDTYDRYDTEDKMVVICTFKLAQKGLSINRIFNLFCIDFGDSFTRVVQSLGRSVRKASDKDSVNMYDISSRLKYSDKHRNSRLKYYEEERHEYKIITIKEDKW